MRYIGVTVDSELLVEELAASSQTEQTITLIVDTTPAGDGDTSQPPVAIARCRAATSSSAATTILAALNASAAG